MALVMGFFCGPHFYLIITNKDSSNTNNAPASFFHLLSVNFESYQITNPYGR